MTYWMSADWNYSLLRLLLIGIRIDWVDCCLELMAYQNYC